MGGEFPPQPPISYLVTFELFEHLMYCVPPPSTKTRGHLWVQTSDFSQMKQIKMPDASLTKAGQAGEASLGFMPGAIKWS